MANALQGNIPVPFLAGPVGNPAASPLQDSSISIRNRLTSNELLEKTGLDQAAFLSRRLVSATNNPTVYLEQYANYLNQIVTGSGIEPGNPGGAAAYLFRNASVAFLDLPNMPSAQLPANLKSQLMEQMVTQFVKIQIESLQVLFPGIDKSIQPDMGGFDLPRISGSATTTDKRNQFNF